MPSKKAAKTSKKILNENVDCSDNPKIEESQVSLFDKEVERQVGAIRAIRDVEIEHLLTELRLLQSYFVEEEVQTPAMQFFKEKFPNSSFVKNEKGKFEVQWKGKHDDLCMNEGVSELDMHASLLLRLSVAFSDCSAIPSLGGLGFSTDAVNRSFFDANLQVPDGQSDSHMFGMHDGLRTPGVSSQMLSIGMTPKTLRLPKPGEMLLSVRGSPLGVYKEDNMEAIHESEEG